MLRPELAYKVGGSQVWRIDARVQASYTPATFDVNPYGEFKSRKIGEHGLARVAHMRSESWVTAALHQTRLTRLRCVCSIPIRADTGLWEEMGRHAGMMHRVSHSPSVAEGIPCWVGQKDGGMRSCIQRESVRLAQHRNGRVLGAGRQAQVVWGRRVPCTAGVHDPSCVGASQVCTERRESDPTAGQVIDGEERGPLIFSSWLSCCAPGTGAFDDGCSFGSRVFYH